MEEEIESQIGASKAKPRIQCAVLLRETLKENNRKREITYNSNVEGFPTLAGWRELYFENISSICYSGGAIKN